MEKRGKRGKEHGDVLSDYIKEFFESWIVVMRLTWNVYKCSAGQGIIRFHET
jgi:hypothetical protein